MEDLKIYKEYVALINYTYLITKKYPSKEKYNLANEIKKNTIEGISYIIEAQKCFNKTDRIKCLNLLDNKLKILKVLVRVSYKQKFINNRNYASWSTKLTNICNMLGGWIKSCQKQ